MQVIHFWATDLVDHFDSGEVKWGYNGAITLGFMGMKFAGWAARLSFPQTREQPYHILVRVLFSNMPY